MGSTIETHPWSRKPGNWKKQLGVILWNDIEFFGGWNLGWLWMLISLSQRGLLKVDNIAVSLLMNREIKPCLLLCVISSDCFINCFNIGCTRYLGRGRVSIKHRPFYNKGGKGSILRASLLGLDRYQGFRIADEWRLVDVRLSDGLISEAGQGGAGPLLKKASLSTPPTFPITH